MKCPMLKKKHKKTINISYSGHPSEEIEWEDFQDCIGENCAWWVEESCAVVGIWDQLTMIVRK